MTSEAGQEDSRARDLFESLIAAYSAPASTVQLVESNTGLVSATLLLCDEVASTLGGRPLAALIEGGEPTAFSFVGLPFPNAAINTSHIEMMWNIRGVMLNPLLEGTRRDQSRRLFLHFVGNLALARGMPDFGARCFIKENEARTTFLGIEGEADIQMLPPDEIYVSALTFGLAHEFGHALNPSSRWSAWLDDASLRDWTAREIEEAKYANPESDEISPDLLLGPAGAALAPRHLRDEIAADCFAIYTQFGTLSRLMDTLNLPLPPPGRVIHNCLLSVASCLVVERCVGVIGLLGNSDLRGLSIANAIAWRLRSISAANFISRALPDLLAESHPSWLASDGTSDFDTLVRGAEMALFAGRTQVFDGFSDALADIKAILAANRPTENRQRQGRLAAAQEAVNTHRLLAKTDFLGSLPGLAMALSNLGNELGRAGQEQAAVEATQKAANISRALAKARPEEHLPALATILNNLGIHLAQAGEQQAALEAAQEAVTISRQLAEANPGESRHALAMAVNNLSIHLAQAGQQLAALEAARETINAYRQLAESEPVAHLPALVTALNNLSSRLAEAGQQQAALEAAQEAGTINRQLAESNPDL